MDVALVHPLLRRPALPGGRPGHRRPARAAGRHGATFPRRRPAAASPWPTRVLRRCAAAGAKAASSRSSRPTTTWSAPRGAASAWCGNHYGDLLPGEPSVEARAGKHAASCASSSCDVLHVEPVAAGFRYQVGLHQSCHGLRELRLGSGSERLGPVQQGARAARSAGRHELVELARPDECCGFGGTFAVAGGGVSCAMGRTASPTTRRAPR